MAQSTQIQDTRTIKSGTYGRFEIARVTLKGGEIGYTIRFSYDDREAGRIRKMGAKWLPGSKVWFMPAARDELLAAYLAIETR